MKKYFTHLSYGGCINLLQQAKGVPVDLWYFVVKTTPGVFKIVEPPLCRVLQSTTIKSPRAVFQYQSKKGSWLSTEHYSFKRIMVTILVISQMPKQLLKQWLKVRKYILKNK